MRNQNLFKIWIRTTCSAHVELVTGQIVLLSPAINLNPLINAQLNFLNKFQEPDVLYNITCHQNIYGSKISFLMSLFFRYLLLN